SDLEAELDKLGLKMDEATKKKVHDLIVTNQLIHQTRERIVLEETRIKQMERERLATPERKQEQLEREQGIFRSEGDETRPRTVEAQIAIWDQVLTQIEERLQSFRNFSRGVLADAIGGLTNALAQGIEAWALYGQSLGKALKQALAAELAQ